MGTLRRRQAMLHAAALLLVLAGGLACAEAAPPRHVVLIVVDTLRADHLSLAGYGRPTSPRLEALAREGTVFTRAYAHSSSTRPSVATILTGRLPSAHGVVTQGADGLAPEVPFLPARLREAGFRTLAFVTNPQVHPKLGFARGFDVFEPIFPGGLEPAELNAFDLVTRPAGEVLARAREAIAAAPREMPLFVYVHLLDPHAPYEPPPGWRERFTQPGYEGPITGTLFDFAADDAMREDPAHLAQFEGLYDGEIAYTDAAIGDFVEWLRREGRLDHTLVGITADHGEEFLEHDDLGHGLTLYEEVVRTPMLWLGAGVPEDDRRDALVGLVDVAPTVLEAVGLPVPEGAFQGRSLFAEGDPAAGVAAREALVLEGPGEGAVLREGRRVPRVVRAVVTGHHKILSPENVRGEAGHGALLLYDQLNGHRLHPTGREFGPDFFPEDLAELVAHEPVQHPTGLLSIDEIDVYPARIFDGLLDSRLGDLPKNDPFGLVGVQVEHLAEVPRNGFSFPVFIRGQPNFICLLSELLQLFDHLLLIGRNYVLGFEVFLHIHRTLALLQVAYVAIAGFYRKILAQVSFNGLGFGRRLYDQ